MDNKQQVVRDFLNNYRERKAKNKNRLLELNLINDGVGTIGFGERTGKTNKINKLVEDVAISNIENREKIEKKYEEEETKLQIMDNAIDALTDIEQEVIKMKYFNKMTWDKISNNIHYSISHCKTINKDSINKLVRILEFSIFFSDSIIS